jgi:hypothetical protein
VSAPNHPDSCHDLGLTLFTAVHINLQKLEDPDQPLSSKSARLSAHNFTAGMSQMDCSMSRSMSP